MTSMYGSAQDGAVAGAAPPVTTPLLAPDVLDDTVQGEVLPQHHSDLDRWALAQFNKLADQVRGEELAQLATHVLKLVKRDDDYWKPAKDRMRNEHEAIALQNPQRPLAAKTQAGAGQQNLAESVAQNEETVILPDTYLYFRKVVNLLAGAGFTWDVPSADLSDIAASQKVEAFLEWAKTEWEHRMGATRAGSPKYTIPQYGAGRGWMAVRTMADLDDPLFPYDFEVCDPLHVNPVFDRKGLRRVTCTYEITVLEAQDLYPEAADMFRQDDQDDDPVEVCSYYDHTYHMILLQGREHTEGIRDSRTIKSPVRHGVIDYYDKPQVPWVIRFPQNDLSEGLADGKASVALTGLGVLFPVLQTYDRVNQLTSMLLTNVARSADPPAVVAIRRGDQGPDTSKLMEPGGRTFIAFNEGDIKLLDTAPNPGNLTPVIQIFTDRLNRSTFPAPFWGEAWSGTSGYAINLLTGAAKDQLGPFTDAIEDVWRGIFRRFLEIALKTVAPTIGTLQMTQRNEGTGRRLTGVTFDPLVIEQTGVDVDVMFGEIMPQDEAALSAIVGPQASSKLISQYTARKKLGIKNPIVEEWRIFRESILANPELAAMVGPQALQMSDDEFLKTTFMAYLTLQAQQQQQQAAEMARQAGKEGPLPTSAVPLEMQPGPGGRAGQAPPAQNPADVAQREMNNGMARLLSTQGGSPPAAE